MGISFRLSKAGTRYRPQPSFSTGEGSKESAIAIAEAGQDREVDVSKAANNSNLLPISSKCSIGHILPEHEVSFTVNLYANGYYVGKPTEVQPSFQDANSLHRYDRASETFFSAIETGWLPGDVLGDIPAKYYDGAVICEVRDYRNCSSEQGVAVSAANWVPIVHKICLRMSLENIVKDIPSISDQNWTYSDLIEVESRILKTLQPRLHLDPSPMLDRLFESPFPTKLDLGVRKKRLRQTPEVTVNSNNQTHGKKICIEMASDKGNCRTADSASLLGNSTFQQVHENMNMQHVSSGVPSYRPNIIGQEAARPTLPMPSQAKVQPTINSPVVMQDRASALNFGGSSANMSSPNMMSSFTDTSSMKRDNQDPQMTSLSTSKRLKQTAIGGDNIPHQHPGSHLIGANGSDMQWRNQLLQQQLDMKGIQYSHTSTGQRFTSPVMNMPNHDPGASVYFTQQGMRYGAKEEHIDRQELERSKTAMQALPSDNSTMDQQQLQHQQSSMRNHLSNPAQWQNARQLTEKDMRKDDTLQRRNSLKSVPSPRVSSSPMVQSPVSSKSGEISSGSIGGQFNAAGNASALGSQKDKFTLNSTAVIGTPSVTSSPSDSIYRKNQGPLTGKRKTNPVIKTHAVSGVGSPVSVSTMNPALNANSPSIGTGPIGDQEILERFGKIEVIAQRHHLNLKKKKADDYPERKPMPHATQELAFCLSDSFNHEDFTDQRRPLSKSLIGGTINTCKSRTMRFIHPERTYLVSTRPHNLLTMSEKPFDGTVSMQYGEFDDSENQDYQLIITLPTTHYADLLAEQFSTLMERSDGYQKTDDQIRPIPIRMIAPSSGLAFSGMLSENTPSETKQSELSPGQSSQVAAQASVNGMGGLNSQNFSNNAGLMASANNSQALTMPQGHLAGAGITVRAQQADQALLQHQQQSAQTQLHQQLTHPHAQRSSSLLSNSPLSQMMGQSSNLQMNANMVNNKSSPLQMLQQQQHIHHQQQQQQQTQLPRKVMMGISPSMNMPNMGNNMISGLAGLGNVIIGSGRGLSSPMGAITGLGNITSNQMNLGTASSFNAGLRGSLSQAQAAAMASKLRMAHGRAGIYGPQSGIASIAGTGSQMLHNPAGLSMLGHPLNRANISPLHRNAMSAMGPPKIPGASFYLNPQQQLQLQQQQQQHIQQLQQQQQQIQQQQIQQQVSSPLQHSQVGSPPLVGSPSSMIIQQQQQISPQQMSQQTAMSPQQLSSGALQVINNGAHQGAAPASPHGSVGSITSSPMEQLQGANKSGSASNNLT